MNWQESRAGAREHFVAKYDDHTARDYDSIRGLGLFKDEDAEACLSDLERVIGLQSGMTVLDVGAGTGALACVLARLPGLVIQALEPSAAMLARLRSKPELAGMTAVEGFSDHPDDRRHFAAASFDVIISRQLANSLLDPLAAFRNWSHWLAPGGAVVVIDGFYTRAAWAGHFATEVDILPLSSCQTTAMIPYLLEETGFHIEAVEMMARTNSLILEATPRYVVVARKPGP